jgi:hypothetical protein
MTDYVYTCEACSLPHRNEFSLTCVSCDSKRESEDLELEDEE